jgi:hypothetical protein
LNYYRDKTAGAFSYIEKLWPYRVVIEEVQMVKYTLVKLIGGVLSLLYIAGCGMFYEVYRDTENRFDDRYGEGATEKTFEETVGKH